MAVTIAELLGAARDQLDGHQVDRTDVDTAMAAAAGLAPISRAVAVLHMTRPYAPYVSLAEERRSQQTVDLADACHAASLAWPSQDARIPTLIGAAADVITARAHAFTGEQRWALTDVLAATARRCVDTAQQFPPYARIPELNAARDAAVAITLSAVRHPPTATGRTALDHLVQEGNLAQSPAERIVDAAAALHNAVTGRARYARPCMAEVVLAVNAAHLAAAHAAALLRDPAAPATAAPQAWHAARLECRGFDDGTKQHAPEASAVAGAAARLGRNLLDHLGVAPPTGGATDTIGNRTGAVTVSALHAVIQLLPDVADRLSQAVDTWAARQAVWAPERQLLGYEDRNAAVTSTDRFAAAEAADLDGLRSALDLSRSLTTALAVDLGDELAREHPRMIRQPNVAAAHHATIRAEQNLSVQAQSAHHAVQRAHILRPHEITLPTPAQRMRPPPTRSR